MVMEKNYLEVKKLLAEHRVLLDKMAAEALSKTTLVLISGREYKPYSSTLTVQIKG